MKEKKYRKLLWWCWKLRACWHPYIIFIIKTVSTNVAKRFLNLLDDHFPKSNKLHAIFKRNTVKISFSCIQNMSSMIKSHNKIVIIKDVKESKSCNCKQFYNHRKSFNNEGSANNTTLSKYIWELKETSNSSPAIISSFTKKVPPYSNTSKKCLLCLHEKILIKIIILDQRNYLTKDLN